MVYRTGTLGIAEQCPADNVCALNAGPECGTVPAHFPALVSAQDLCLPALNAAIRLHSQAEPHEDPYVTAVRKTKLMWLYAESAQSPAIDNREAKLRFTEATNLASGLCVNSALSISKSISASLLLAQLPALHQLRDDRLMGTASRRHIRQSIIEQMDRVSKAPLHPEATVPRNHMSAPNHKPCISAESGRTIILARLAGHSLLLDNDLSAYTASHREVGKDSSTRHNTFIITENYKKVPTMITNKELKTTSPTVLLISMQTLVADAIAEVGAPDTTSYTTVLGWLGRRTVDLKPIQKEVLKAMGEKSKNKLVEWMIGSYRQS